MTISREQLIRGFSAIRASFDRQVAMNVAALEAGIEDYDYGQSDAPRGGRYCRRGQALSLIEQDGSLRLVRPPYTDLEWTPG